MKRIISGGLVFVCLLVCLLSTVAGADKVQYKVWEGKLNLNGASTAELTMLDGIGKVTAHRIVTYREKVGGFKSIAQLKEVKGVSAVKVAELEDHLSLFEKSDLRVLVDINTAPLSALMALPGISKKLGIGIIEYRERNDGFKVVEDMLKIEGVGMSKFKELQAFVAVRPLKVAVKENP